MLGARYGWLRLLAPTTARINPLMTNEVPAGRFAGRPSGSADELRQSSLTTISTVDALEATLTARMLAGDYIPGARLRESALAAEYRVSRHTLRAALTRLSSAGVLDFDANKGWAVLALTAEDFQDIAFVRIGFEVQAVRALAGNGHGIGTVAHAALADITATGPHENWPTRLHKDMQFHLALIDAADSPRLSRLYRQLQLSLHLYLIQRIDWFAPQPLRQWKSIHVVIADTIAAGDPDRAEAAIRNILQYPPLEQSE